MIRHVMGQLSMPLVLISLIALIPLSVGVQYQIAESWSALGDFVHPTRERVARMQVLLSREVAALRGFLLTEQQSYVDEHYRTRTQRRLVQSQLLDDSKQIRSDFQAEVRQLVDVLDAADVLIDSLYSGQITPDEYLTHLPVQHGRFTEVTASVDNLNAILGRTDAETAAWIARIQRLETVLIVVLVLFALAGVLAVAHTSRRYRLHAEREHAARASSEEARAEAERRRLEVERLRGNWQMLIRGFSHDLRNPLNAAVGFLRFFELGMLGPLTPQQDKGVRTARRSLDVAARLVNDLLTLAQAEAGQINVTRAPVDLVAVTRAVADEYRALAEEKGLTLAAEVAAEVPAIASDGARVRQILSNLIANAINYTLAGSVTLRVGTENRAADEPGSWATVEVSDTGPGLAADEQRMAFEEFRRFDTSAETRGWGIGLTISEGLARALGGHITVLSEPGRGAAFTLHLPLVAAGEPAEADAQVTV